MIEKEGSSSAEGEAHQPVLPVQVSPGTSTAQTGPVEGMVSYQVELRVEDLPVLRAIAAREGCSLEALLALWIEEKLVEARKLSGL